MLKCKKGSFSLYLEPGSESTPLGQIEKVCGETGKWSDNTLQCLRKQFSFPSYPLNLFFLMKLFNAPLRKRLRSQNIVLEIQRLK